jgi:hypothetical protein
MFSFCCSKTLVIAIEDDWVVVGTISSKGNIANIGYYVHQIKKLRAHVVWVVEHDLCSIDPTCVLSKDSNINTTLVVRKTKLKKKIILRKCGLLSSLQ